jgi:hypothetical protein
MFAGAHGLWNINVFLPLAALNKSMQKLSDVPESEIGTSHFAAAFLSLPLVLDQNPYAPFR